MADVNNDNKENNSEQSTTQESPLDQKMIDLVNSAVSSHMKRFTSKLPDLIRDALPAPAEAAKSSETSNSKASPDALSEVQKLRTELDAERKRNREKETYNNVRSYLSDKVRPEALEAAVKVLKADELVKFKRDGTPLVKFSETEEYDLEEGLHQWLDSKEAQIFRPAPSAKGSPQRPTYSTPSKVSNGRDDSGNNLTPSEKALQQLTKMGINI